MKQAFPLMQVIRLHQGVCYCCGNRFPGSLYIISIILLDIRNLSVIIEL